MDFKPQNISRYKDIGLLFMRFLLPAIRESHSMSSDLADPDEKPSPKDPKEFAEALEKMGPTFVKFGQLLSTRGDLLSSDYTEALEHLQDQVSPVPFDTIREIVESELKVKISKAFKSFEEQPIASASLGQVHNAVLRNGEEVVVKVQRKGIRLQITQDIEVLSSIAAYAEEHTEFGSKYGFSDIVERLRRSLIEELDYGQEAQNLIHFKKALKDFPHLRVPVPHRTYSTRKVLTMSRVTGKKVTEITGVEKTELDGYQFADEIFNAYLHQVLIEGFYHADPHPGNLLLTPDRKIALVDLGMVGRLNERMRHDIFDLLEGISHNQGERVGETAINISGTDNREVNKKGLVSDLSDLIGRARNASVEEMEVGSVLMEVMKICGSHGLEIPREMSMLGKTMMNLDRVGIALCPEFNPMKSLREHMTEIARKRALESLKPTNVVSQVVQLKEMVGKSPQRINAILDILADNRLKLDVDAVDERELIRGFQKIANRITVGVIIAAMIIGAAYLMRVETSFRLFGYPGIPMLLFLFAAIGGALVVFNIYRHDR